MMNTGSVIVLGAKTRRTSARAGSLLAMVALATTVKTAAAQNAEVPRLETNQAYLEEVMRTTTLSINDPIAVFAFVLGSLPDRVKVYPTENYYYFSFVYDGKRYAGNIRLDASNRDEGKVIFTYFEDETEWHEDVNLKHIVLEASQGVTVEKLEKFLYRLSYKG